MLTTIFAVFAFCFVLGRHKNNYGDIVLWDWLFGTYENPALFESSCGFDAEKEESLLDMLVYRDVHR